MCIIRKKIQVFSHISAIIQIFWNNRNQYLKSINILYTYTYHRTCFHSIFSLFINFQKKVKRKSYFTFSRINSDSSTYNDIHNHGHNGAEKGSTIPTVRLTHPPCHPALMYTWFATQVICNTRRFSFRLCYEIPDHLHSHGWIFIYSNMNDGNSWRNDQRAFRKEWVRGSIPRFTRIHTPWSILFLP